MFRQDWEVLSYNYIFNFIFMNTALERGEIAPNEEHFRRLINDLGYGHSADLRTLLQRVVIADSSGCMTLGETYAAVIQKPETFRDPERAGNDRCIEDLGALVGDAGVIGITARRALEILKEAK